MSMLGNRKTDVAAAAWNGPSGGDRAASLQLPTSGDRTNDPVHSIVDKHLTMKGDLESEGDVLVRGKVIGNIKCKLLIVDIDAQIDGGVEAEEVVIRGKAKGKVQADRVRLEKTAVVDCEIAHRSFSAEEGARIKGTLRFLEDPEPGMASIGIAA